MVGVGYPASVAPLGTALTENQLALLWKMADEPILCFDGDRAGRKAAHRAIDTALPLIGPGRSLRFALLPEGQDPDDLARSGGAAAVGDVIGAACPLVDLIWQRETEAGDFATPERRAGLERRLAEVCGEIRDETLRRYYLSEFRSRLATFFTGQRPAKNAAAAPPSFSRREERSGRAFAPREPNYLSMPPQVGQSLAQSALMRSNRTGIPGREAVILLLFLNHPGLLEAYGEALAELEFTSPEARALRSKMLDLWAQLPVSGEAMGLELDQSGFQATRQRLAAAQAHSSLWVLQPAAAMRDAEEVLKQALALHRKSRDLHRELQLAEHALASETSEANFARLKDIHQQLAQLVGLEAAVEGFGAASGRPSGSL
jgi:DNA primase